MRRALPLSMTILLLSACTIAPKEPIAEAEYDLKVLRVRFKAN